MHNQILLGDCLDKLKEIPDASVDSVVVDPPYGLGTKEPTVDEIIAYLQGAELKQGGDFMARNWDVPSVAVWKECFRVLKPGGHVLSFGGTRTFDLISLGLRAAGFENRDTIASQFGVAVLQWLQGQGFPKSMNVSKQLDKQGEVEAAQEFAGFGTALKPSWEPILVFRKPIDESTVAKQILATRTGAMNIDGCRVQYLSESDKDNAFPGGAITSRDVTGGGLGCGQKEHERKIFEAERASGRWPSNVLLTHADGCTRTGSTKVDAPVINRFTDGAKPFGNGAGHEYESEQRGDADGKEEIAVYECQDGCPVKKLNEQSGPTGGAPGARNNSAVVNQIAKGDEYEHTTYGYSDTGGAARFFPQFEQEPYECVEGCPIKTLDDQSGVLKTSGGPLNRSGIGFQGGSDGNQDYVPPSEGGASRFFPQFEPLEAPFMYQGKITKRERDDGLPKGTNTHPTVKPQQLMRWLVRLVTPKGGTVLDPYSGSGSTLVAAVKEGFNFIGIERDPEFHRIASMRVEVAMPKRDVLDEMEGL